MSVKLLTEKYLEFLSVKRGCTGSSESKLVKMPHCWESHDVAQLLYNRTSKYRNSDCLLRKPICDIVVFISVF